MPNQAVQCPHCAFEWPAPPGADSESVLCPKCGLEIPLSILLQATDRASQSASSVHPGQEIGGYVVEQFVAAGDVAAVFRGRQVSSGMTVALKFLAPDLAQSPQVIERIEEEARAAVSLSNPHIVPLLDLVQDTGVLCVVTEFVEGVSLKTLLAGQSTLAPERVLDAAVQILDGLACAHAKGLAHRGLKPGNIFFDAKGTARLTDFCMARSAAVRGSAEQTLSAFAGGSLMYLAPEQLAGEEHVDARADLYSLGVVIYQALTGRLPVGLFSAPSEIDPRLDPRWDDIIAKALRAEPDNRYPDAASFARDLQAIRAAPAAPAPAEAVVCPECFQENPARLSQCEACGATLAAASTQAETTGSLKASRDLVRDLVQRKQYDQAIGELEGLSRKAGPGRERLRAGVARLIEKVRQAREAHYGHVYDAGSRMALQGRIKEALGVWESLPDAYRDIRRLRVEARRAFDQGTSLLEQAARAYKKGEMEKTLELLEKASAIWPANLKIHQQVFAARQKLATDSVRHLMLHDARKAMDRADFECALILVSQTLEIAPDDAEASELRARIRKAQQKRKRPAPKRTAAPIIFRSRRSAQPVSVNLTVFLAVLAAVFVVAGLVIAAFVLTSDSRCAPSSRHLAEIGALEDQGLYETALAKLRDVAQAPGDPSAASFAQEEIKRLLAALNAAKTELERIAALCRQDRLEEAVAALLAFRRGEYGRIDSCKPWAAKLAAQILDAAKVRAAPGRPRHPLAWHAEAGAVLLALATDDGDRALAAAFKARLDAASLTLAQARAALDAGRADEARDSLLATLDRLPGLAEAEDLLATALVRATPPPGMVLVPAGQYPVGLPGPEQRQFQVSVPFYVDAHEVTTRDYVRFLEATRHPAPARWRANADSPSGWSQTAQREIKECGDLPMTGVSCEDASAYAKWAGKDLPTEDEWEAAARGPQGRRFPSGNDWSPAVANLGFGPAPGGQCPRDRSFCGAWDMAGNVAEWTRTPIAPPAPPLPPPQPAQDASVPSPRHPQRPKDDSDLAERYVEHLNRTLGRMEGVIRGEVSLRDVKREQARDDQTWDKATPSTEKSPPAPACPGAGPSGAGTARDQGLLMAGG